MSFENITRRLDGSYIITRNGYPYHVPNENEFADLWEQIHAHALAHPEEVTPEALPPEPEPPTWEESRAAAVQAVKNRSWRAETGGIVIQGMPIPTDRESQAMITGAVVGAMLNPTAVTRWQTSAVTAKGAPVFVDLTSAQLQGIGMAVRAHVQACFDVRDAKCAAVARQPSVEAVAAWLEENLDNGWPG